MSGKCFTLSFFHIDMKNKFVAALLAIFGGPLGLHKFYLGDTGAGIFYIFLTLMTANVFPVSFLLGLIDGLRYFMMPPEEFDRKFSNRRRARRRGPRERRRQPRSYQVERKPKSRKTRTRNNPFKKSGLRKYKEYDIEEAIDDFHKAIKIDPNDVAIYFNLACAYSLLENKEKAFHFLEVAVAKGLTDHERISTHDDLAFIRIQPEYQDFKAAGFRMKKTQSKKEDQTDSDKPMDDILLAQLNRLMELRKKGVLTEQEFIRERKKVLAR